MPSRTAGAVCPISASPPNSGHPGPPPAAGWAAQLAACRNAKFDAVAETYRRTGLDAGHPDGALAAANIEFTIRYYVRLALLRSGPARRRLHRTIDPRGAEPVFAAAAEGRGVLLVSAHLGDFDIVGSWLAARTGRAVVVAADRLPQAARQWWFEDVRRAAGLTVRDRRLTRVATVEADLQAGRIVLWMLDRAAPGPRLDGRLLGCDAQLPLMPFVLARRTGARMICATTVTAADGRRRVLSGPRTVVDRRAADPATVVGELANQLGEQIRTSPWQWHVPAAVEQLSIAPVEVAGAAAVLPTDLRRSA